jgi:hypothetical protein
VHRLSGGLVLGFHGCAELTASTARRQAIPPEPERLRLAGRGHLFLGIQSSPRTGIRPREDEARRTQGTRASRWCRSRPRSVSGSDHERWNRSDAQRLRPAQQELPCCRYAFTEEQGISEAARLCCDQLLHQIRASHGLEAVQTVRGVFIEGALPMKARGSRQRPTFNLPFVIRPASRACFVFPITSCRKVDLEPLLKVRI